MQASIYWPAMPKRHFSKATSDQLPDQLPEPDGWLLLGTPSKTGTAGQITTGLADANAKPHAKEARDGFLYVVVPIGRESHKEDTNAREDHAETRAVPPPKPQACARCNAKGYQVTLKV